MQSSTGIYRWIVLAVLFVNFLLFSFAFGVVPPLFTEIGKQLPMSMAQMGTTMAMFSLAGIFFAPLGGVMGDKIGCRWAFGLGVTIMAISGGARCLVDSLWQMYACMFFVGAGLGVSTAVVPKAIGNWFPPQQFAMANGIVSTGLGIGGAVAYATAASILSPALGGWRHIMLAIGAISLLCALIWMFVYKEPEGVSKGTETASESLLSGLLNVFKIREVVLTGVFFGLALAGILSCTQFLPVVLENRGIARAGELVSIIMVTSVLFNIIGGMISDKVGKRKPFLIFPAIVFGICLPFFIILKGVALILALVVAGAAAGFIAPITFAMLVEMKKVGAQAGTAVGLVLMLGNAGGFFGPVISGMVMDQAKEMAGFAFMSAALIIAAIVMIPIRDTGRNIDIEKNEKALS